MTSPAWIAALKVGDRIAATYSRSWQSSRAIGSVVRITPSGRVFAQIAGQQVAFNSNGAERGRRYWQLVELTPDLERDIREGAERTAHLRALDSTRWKDLPLETLRAVAALLPEKEKE